MNKFRLYPCRGTACLSVRFLLPAVMVLWLSGCAVAVKQATPGPDPAAAAAPSLQAPSSVQARRGPEMTSEFLFHYLLADIAARRGHLTESVDALITLARQSQDPDMTRRAFSTAMHGKMGEAALEMAELIRQLDPSSLRSAFARIQALLLLERRTEAVDDIRALLLSPGVEVSRVFNNASEVFSRQQNPEDFIEDFKALVDLHPNNPDAQYALAYLSNRAGNMAVLEIAINRALELRPDWETAALVKFSYLVSQSGPVGVAEFTEDFLKRFPDALELRERYGRYLVSKRQLKSAMQQFARIVSAQPDNAEAILAAAIVRMELEEFPAAKRYLRRYLKLKPDDDQARLLMGQAESDSRRYARAIEWYSQIDGDEYYIEAQIDIGMAIMQLEGYEAALEHLHELIPKNLEEEVRIYLAQERILRESKRIEEALSLMDAAVQEVPDNSELLYTRALLAVELNLLDRHEKDIRKVIQLDPQNAHAYNALGYTLADQKTRLSEAFQLITKALDLAPNDPFILDSMGWVHFRLGRLEEAIGFLRRAIAIRHDPEIAAHLGEVLWVSGNQEEAEQVWQLGIEKDPGNQTLQDTLNRLRPQ